MPMEEQRGSRGIPVFMLDVGTSWGWVVNATPWPLYPAGSSSVTHCERGWLGPKAVLEKRKISCLQRSSNPKPSSLYRRRMKNLLCVIFGVNRYIPRKCDTRNRLLLLLLLFTSFPIHYSPIILPHK